MKNLNYHKPASSLFQRRESRMAFKGKPPARTVLIQIAVAVVVFLSRYPDGCQTHDKAVAPALKGRQEQPEGEAYCSTNNVEEAQNLEKHCIPCPENAECMANQMVCKPGYRVRDFSSAPHSKNTHAVSCVEDLEAKARAASTLKAIVDLLRERRGRYECGLPLDPLFSPSYQFDNKPWSTAIKDMCSGPGVTRWQMHFHRNIAPAIADKGVYFWLFNHFLSPDTAAALGIQVERHYLFVPLANPVDFPELHERIMEEHIRTKGITYMYKYKGTDPLKPLSCKIGSVAQDHLLTILTLLTVFIVCSHFAHHLYFKNYIRKQVLSLIRLYSQHGGVASLTRGVPTESLFQLLCKDLANAGCFTRFLVKNKLTLESVDEACHELLWSPKTGVHAYTLYETHHWWAEKMASSSSSQGRDNTGGLGSPTKGDGGLTVSVSPPEGVPSNTSLSFDRQLSEPTGSSDVKTGTTPVHSRLQVDLQFPTSVWGYGSPYVISDPPTATRVHAGPPYSGFEQENTLTCAKRLDDYTGLTKELWALQRAKRTISGELERRLRPRGSIL